MPKKPRKTKRRKPSNNPLENLNLSPFLEPEQVKEKKKSDTYKGLQKEYERILHKEIQRENRAYRVVFKNHPDLLYIAFCGNRGSAKYQASRYFKSIFHPFFTGENYSEEMLKCNAYRVKELDKYALKGTIPIPELLKATDTTMACSVCGKDHFDYSDCEIGRCFIVEGEGDLNPFTKGYILCYDCHKKYLNK